MRFLFIFTILFLSLLGVNNSAVLEAKWSQVLVAWYKNIRNTKIRKQSRYSSGMNFDSLLRANPSRKVISGKKFPTLPNHAELAKAESSVGVDTEVLIPGKTSIALSLIKKNNIILYKEKKMSSQEPLLVPSEKKRYTVLPIEHSDIWEFFKKHETTIWNAQEIDYSADLNDWKTLSDNERLCIKNVLAFFAGSDGIVLENLLENFGSEMPWMEVRAFYSIQGFIETVHGETYALHLNTLVTDSKERNRLFQAIETVPCVKRKAEWALKWTTNSHSLAHRLLAFAIVEGLFFSGSFCIIFWLASRNKMVKGLGHSNEFISRDEGLHTQFACLLYNKYVKGKLSRNTVTSMFEEAVEIESEFASHSMPERLEGMNSDLMSQYIRYVANRLLLDLGYPEIYFGSTGKSETNPFPFMEALSLDNKTNFFEKRSSEYSRSLEKTRLDFALTEDF